MSQGGVIEVEARREGDRIEIVVSDSGPGIPLEDLSEVFKPHYSKKASGSGLGLHVVDQIVRQNGGVVRATSRGSIPGASFQITLPSYFGDRKL